MRSARNAAFFGAPRRWPRPLSWIDPQNSTVTLYPSTPSPRAKLLEDECFFCNHMPIQSPFSRLFLVAAPSYLNTETRREEGKGSIVRPHPPLLSYNVSRVRNRGIN